ncbi:MAG: aminotransferase class I/II-fold pyridoxal phosphate-dependent enzyme [Akkermansiaceae bacterium]|nr:aminotransferase class I/II-fold pyridoxal phosphate-dependent enzyme [Akkermansiaceae bacterium]
MIPLCVPHIRDDEWELVKKCIDSEWVSYAGSFVNDFEKEIATYVGSSHAAVTISGTSAIHIALIVSGVLPDDEVLLPSLSFVAPANAIRYCNAWPVFIDVSSNTWQLDTDKLEDFLRNHCERKADGSLKNRHTGRRIGAVMPVHLLGGMADMDRILSLCHEFDLPLIEDAAEAFGSRWTGRGIGAPGEAGNENISRIVCTSFNGNKIMTTGGGGALITNCERQAARARHLSTTAKTDPIEFDHDEVGFNYRMSNMAAALGVGQLRQMDHFIARKTAIANTYNAAFANHPRISGSCPTTPGVTSNNWLYTLRLREKSRPILDELALCGIQTRPLWKPLSTLSFLTDCHIHSDAVTRELAENCLSIPCSVGLSEAEQQEVIDSLHEILSD